MTHINRKVYTEQTFDHLTSGLDGISPDQIAEHLPLYAGYVQRVNALNEELGSLRERGRARAAIPSSPS
jgi:Fe-Mn family superoxide dismutase